MQSNNDIAISWTRRVEPELNAESRALGIKHRPGSKFSRIRGTFKAKAGEIYRIMFGIPRHAVFVKKGVGKGTPISKVGSTKRVPKEWTAPIDRNIEQLADDIAENTGDEIMNRIHF